MSRDRFSAISWETENVVDARAELRLSTRVRSCEWAAGLVFSIPELDIGADVENGELRSCACGMLEFDVKDGSGFKLRISRL